MLQFNFFKNKYGSELLVDCMAFADLWKRVAALQKPYSTTFYEIFFFHSGEGYIMIDDEKLAFQAGSILLLTPARPRQWIFKSKPDATVIFFEGEFLETFLKDDLFLYRLHYFGNSSKPSYFILNKKEIEVHVQLLHHIKKEIVNLAHDSEHLLRAYLYQLLITLNRQYADQYHLKDNVYANAELLKFRKLLSVHIKTKQTVNEYAGMMGMNRNRLNRLCHEAYGKDASEIIKGKLLLACKNELLFSDKTIAEIAHEFNFSAPSNFTRFFKSITKISPADYKDRYAN